MKLWDNQNMPLIRRRDIKERDRPLGLIDYIRVKLMRGYITKQTHLIIPPYGSSAGCAPQIYCSNSDAPSSSTSALLNCVS